MSGGDIWAIIAGGVVGTVMNEGCRKVNVMNRGVIDGDCCPDVVGGSCERPGHYTLPTTYLTRTPPRRTCYRTVT
jgi:hypothetical protein